MSLKNWLFGSEEPGKEAPANAKPSATPSPAGSPSPAATRSAEPEAKPLADSAPPVQAGDVEHTQILTKEQLKALGDQDREKAKPIKFVPPAAKKAETKSDSESKPPQAKPEKQTNPDPQPSPVKAAVWKTEPVNEPWAPSAITDAFPELARRDHADHEAVERILPGGWRLLGASRRGRKQAHDARFREDAMAFGADSHITILAVADGAGSSKYSRIGSHLAVQETVGQLLTAADAISDADRQDRKKLEAALKDALTAAVKAARQRVVATAEKASLNPKEFRATLLTVIHWRDTDCELLLSNQVGDGAIAVLRSDQTILKFGESDSGAFSGEVSCFLTDADAEKKAANVQVIDDVAKVEGLFLCSDGIEDPFYPIDKKALDIFRQWHAGVTEPLEGFKSQPRQEPVFRHEAAAGELARWLEFEKRGENDDRTVMLLHRLPVRVNF